MPYFYQYQYSCSVSQSKADHSCLHVISSQDSLAKMKENENSSFSPPHIILNLYAFLFSVEDKIIFVHSMTVLFNFFQLFLFVHSLKVP